MLRKLFDLALVTAVLAPMAGAIQLPGSGPMRAIEATPGQGSLGSNPPAAGTGLVPITPRSQALPADPPSALLGSPTIDPYATGSAAGTFNPGLSASPAPSTLFGGGLGTSLFGGPTNSVVGYPPGTVPPAVAPYDSAPIASPSDAYPPSIYPNQTPSTLFPEGPLSGGLYRGNGGAGLYGVPVVGSAMRFLHGPRLQYTYISGGDAPDELGIDEIDSSLAFAFPNFLYSTQPLYVVPTFGLRLLDGPMSPPADLPGQLYEASLGAGWQTDPNRLFGAELGLKVGAFSDFETFNSDSIRYMGQGLGKLRLTPTLTGKLGVMYVDRVETKIIPAGGLLWQPSPDVRYDIYFPSPKLARYFTTLGTHDIWTYIAGEYGGGSWTIERAAGTEDEIDINDLRVMLGMEFGRNDQLRVGRRVGFAEIGYVFEREIVYRRFPPPQIDLDDAIMFRLGVGY